MGDNETEASVPRGNQPAVIDSDATCISVDAGAGTGKTTTMLMRLERTLANGDAEPNDILVLTFANEAASNIRSSIANRLDPAVAAEIDVYTYHSFCHRLVREYAYYLGLSPSFDIATERDRYRLIRRLLTERDYAFVDDSVGSDQSATPETLADAVDEFIAVLSRDDIEPDALEAGLPDARTIDLLDELLLWLRQEATSELSFDNEAFRFFNRDEHLEDARAALVEYGKLLTFCREKIAEAPADFREDAVVRDIERYLRSVQSCVTNVHDSLTLDEPTTKHLAPLLFRNQVWRDATATIEQTPIGRLEHYVAVLREARQYTAIYRDYRELLAEEGTLDFDELVRTATRLLADENVADEIAAEYTHVYCDEFQDTDRTQYQLVTKLTNGPDRPELLAIGDTDQAIYGWRGTDPHGLERLGDAYTDHESIELGLNYRSKQEILDLTNYCDYGGHSSKTLREYGRETDPALPTPPTTDTDSTRHVVKIDSDELGWSTPEQVGMTIARLLTDEFDGVAQRRLEDIAVIVRTNAQASAVADELEARQIPYEQSGSPAGTVSPGVQTLLSFLRVIAEPAATDTHLRRVLLLRYRLSEADLERLHELDTDGLYSALVDVDPETVGFDEPERLERASADLQSLVADRDAYPLSPFLERFEERTRIEWFLGPDDGRALDRLHRFVDAYDGGDVLGSLSPRVVDALEGVLRSGSSDRQQGTTSTDSVDIMTVHQAKGLQFDTVLVPFLSDEHWCVRGDYAYSSRHQLLTATLDPAIDSPLRCDLATEPLAEAWRVLHVALTRAESHLFVFGSDYDYEGDENALGRSTVDACLADDIEWSVAGERMDLWEVLTESFERLEAEYPKSVVDATAELAEASATVGGMVSYDDADTELSTTEALETSTHLGWLFRRGQLLPAADAAPYTEAFDVPKTRRLGAIVEDATRFSVTDGSSLGDSTIPGALRHSYSALESHEECPRKHYLDHVVGAFDDPIPQPQVQTDTETADTVPPRDDGNARLVGTVFHAVAESAFYRNDDTPGAWHEAAVSELAARGERTHEEAVRSCIDHYFEARTPAFDEPFHEWDELAAELAFEVDDLPGIDGAVIGYIDTVRRLPDGRLGVFDYKTVGERIEPAMATQLSLYARACARQFDEPVSTVGYVYVGDVDPPRVDHVSLEEIPSWESVRATLEAVDDPGYSESNPGPACRFCTHRSLGCAELPDEETSGSSSLER